MIAKTGFAIASEESRYTLNGALMVLKPEGRLAWLGEKPAVPPLAPCLRSCERWRNDS